IHGQTVVLEIFIARINGESNSADCVKIYNLVYPKVEEEIGPLRDLHLEVSTPGLQRTIKDPYEFTLFIGRSVRIYDNERKCSISGVIEKFEEDKLTLSSCTIGDSQEKMDRLAIEIQQIQKAKLEYRWEDVKNGN
ncbi:MAG: ribosome assembly cofactor RimP, partial [Sphaerochaetaceae bacterium]